MQLLQTLRNPGAAHELAFSTPHPPDEVFRRFERYANERGWSFERNGDNSAEAKQGMTWRSWGQRIRLDIKATDGGSEIYASTRASQLHDWEQGAEMLEQIRVTLA